MGVKSRTATCVPLVEDALCLTFDQEVFRNILGYIARETKNKRIELLKMSKIFQVWDDDQLAVLTSFMLFRTWKKGVPIYKEGECSNAKYYYIIVDGMVEIESVYTVEET